jgi:hypothetical protein
MSNKEKSKNPPEKTAQNGKRAAKEAAPSESF